MADLGFDIQIVGEALETFGFAARPTAIQPSGMGLNTFGFLWDSNWSNADANVTTTWTAADASVSTTWDPAGLPPFA